MALLPTSDVEAWNAYPHHRRWFNKLELALGLGHDCGPCGVAPSIGGWYVVRPIYNLEGMGVGARKQFIEAGNSRAVEPGYFWCEWFSGPQHSVTFHWNAGWQQDSCWEGVLASSDSLSRFNYWRRSDWIAALPHWFNILADCEVINVEFVAGRIIEVHLRGSADPDSGSVIVPVWQGDSNTQVDIESFDDAGGFLSVPRLGFRIADTE